jgi:uncharacterized tellurite resistance protein B-like protein
MKEYDFRLARTIQTIQDTELYENTSEICSTFTEHQKLYLTSYFALTIAVSLADGMIYKAEIDYISNSLPKNLKIDENTKDSLVELNVSHAILAKGYSTALPHFVKYLDQNMNEDAKLKVIRLLFNLALADGSMDPIEDKFITNLSRKFSISDDHISIIRKHCIDVASTKEEKENVELDFLKNIKTVPPKESIHRKDLNDVSHEIIIGQMNKFKDNPISFFIGKICKNLPNKDLLFITSYLGLSFSLIAADGEIHEKEVNYIKHEFSSWFQFEKQTIEMLIDLNIYISETKNLSDELNDHYINLLNLFLNSQERKNFATILINLAATDEKLSPLELNIINKVTDKFEFKEQLVNEIKDSALGLDGSYKIVHSSQKWDNTKS